MKTVVVRAQGGGRLERRTGWVDDVTFKVGVLERREMVQPCDFFLFGSVVCRRQMQDGG